MDHYHEPDAPRLSIEEVEVDVNYALIINNNAGLWGYRLGDTIRFVSLDPCRIMVTGRTAHFISAFGEHVIAEEVEGAMKAVCDQMNLDVVEFTVAPRMGDGQIMPRHEWFIEFAQLPDNVEIVSDNLNKAMQSRNTYYNDLITGSILAPLAIFPIRPGGFRDYQRANGKLGGQNKVARLANNRVIADSLIPFQWSNER